ncbi:MAG TPA: hypothetical protein VFH56_05745 [Acidimicrobiales bacterium]|nr:hypothetical protein [Acidimicrobiales bacterium]
MRDLDEFFNPTLRLPIHGKVYVVASPDAKTGLRVQRLMSVGAYAAAGGEVTDDDLDSLEFDDDEERDLYLRILGPAYDEMVADGLPWEIVQHAGQTALTWVAFGRDAADRIWESVGEPQRPEPQDRKAPAAKKKSARQGSRGGSTGRSKQTVTSPSTES